MTYSEAKAVLAAEMQNRGLTMRELADDIMNNEKDYLTNSRVIVLGAFELYINSL